MGAQRRLVGGADAGRAARGALGHQRARTAVLGNIAFDGGGADRKGAGDRRLGLAVADGLHDAFAEIGRVSFHP